MATRYLLRSMLPALAEQAPREEMTAWPKTDIEVIAVSRLFISTVTIILGAIPATFWAALALYGVPLLGQEAFALLVRGEAVASARSFVFAGMSILGLFGTYGLWAVALRPNAIGAWTAACLVAGIAGMVPVIVLQISGGNWEGSLDNVLASFATAGPVGIGVWHLLRRSGVISGVRPAAKR